MLAFRFNNNEHRPVLDGLQPILAHADAKTTYYPPGTHVQVKHVVKADWREFALDTDPKGKARVVRLVYECCVLQALRDCLRCKEIWVVGADRWRNPDEDLPQDFDAQRTENYRKLALPLAALEFPEAVRLEMREELDKLHHDLPKLSWLSISDKYLGGAIKLNPLDALPEPKNLRRLKKYIEQRWGTTPLIEFLKEAVLRTGALTELTGVGTRTSLSEADLTERLLLCTYGYGTNSGLRAVAAGDHPHTEEDIRYTARRYLTPTGLKAMAVAIANATFAARQETIWGQGTTTVASDSTHFAAWDRNIFTE
ncbi:hypothetical protein GCM10010245_92090 [Streptomyces spectabilis]|uniref:Tn3 transposase DDE domain-containing protein n=1 Tax=Streptomyces spectabilis TaxID=68270 RepID=A0A7W8B4D3_STRST|nr:hypothetical protein [Streptomyces spectabilis]GGV58967.1 hypothetical protein GCM10010245_92090 [Streptomyces spectabilis]